MIERAMLGKITFAGKSLQEVVRKLREQGYTVDVDLESDAFVLTVVQKIRLPLDVMEPRDVESKEAGSIGIQTVDALPERGDLESR